VRVCVRVYDTSVDEVEQRERYVAVTQRSISIISRKDRRETYLR
jgi:hypothetical protein